MKINKKVVVGVVGGLVVVGCAGCWPSTASAPQNSEQKQANAGANALLQSQPVPVFGYSQLRQNVIDLETAQAEGVVSISYFMRGLGGAPYMTCPSIGAPISSTTELTNPLQLTSQYAGSTGAVGGTIGQMDPTGVYPGNSTGTYVMCTGSDGSVTPIYWEGPVFTTFGPSHWDSTTMSVVLDGPSSAKFKGLHK